jgi:hypothetical protein
VCTKTGTPANFASFSKLQEGKGTGRGGGEEDLDKNIKVERIHVGTEKIYTLLLLYSTSIILFLNNF